MSEDKLLKLSEFLKSFINFQKISQTDKQSQLKSISKYSI